VQRDARKWQTVSGGGVVVFKTVVDAVFAGVALTPRLCAEIPSTAAAQARAFSAQLHVS
jgi:hypothetical protein